MERLFEFLDMLAWTLGIMAIIALSGGFVGKPTHADDIWAAVIAICLAWILT